MRTKNQIFRTACLLAALALLSTGCGSPELGTQDQPLDADGDGFCDIDELEPPPHPPDIITMPAPFDLRITVSLADGIRSPRQGRMALLINQDPFVGIHELFATQLPDTLPAVVDMQLGPMPREVIDEAIQGLESLPCEDPPTYEEDGVWIHAAVVIYDDANGNGQVDFGSRYLTSPGPGAGDEEWERYSREHEAWDRQYGHLNFIGLSSPSDPDNEVLSLGPLTTDYLENILDPKFMERHTGYQLTYEKMTCTTKRRDLEGGSWEECSTCRDEIDLADPDEIQPMTVSWALPD